MLAHAKPKGIDLTEQARHSRIGTEACCGEWLLSEERGGSCRALRQLLVALRPAPMRPCEPSRRRD